MRAQKAIKRTKEDKALQIIIVSTLFLLIVITLQPIFHLLAVSLSEPSKVQLMEGIEIFPKGFSIDVWAALLKNPQILKGIYNSLLITIVGTFINITFTSLMAWPLAQKTLPFRRVILLFILITMVFEPGIIPDYLLMKKLNLLDSYWSMFLYKAVNAWYLIILIRFFEDIPTELVEAAEIEGANPIQVMLHIVIPLSLPALATITLFYLIFHWNEYFRSMIYLTQSAKWPLQVVLRQFVVEGDKVAMVGLQAVSEYSGAGQLDMRSLKAAMILMTMIPVLLVYPLILKFFTKGTMSGGVKG